MLMKVVSMKSTCLIATLALLGLNACGVGSQESTSGSKAIIGNNDLTKVGFSNADYVQATGIMKVGCTVTHIGGGYAITAGHCVYDFDSDMPAPKKVCDSSMNVTWAYTDDNQSGTFTSECDQILAQSFNPDLDDQAFATPDYVILHYKTAPKASLKLKVGELAVGEKVSIFSYPQGRTLEWSGWCEVTETNLARSGQFGYQCDTQGGSSGATVLNSKYEIIGIHNGYRSDLNANYATPLTRIPLAAALPNL
jgi:V8-like Glu-specific endopeptidase